MTVKEIITLAAELTGEKDACSFLGGEAADDETYGEKTSALLRRCYDMVIDELACEYLPLVKSEILSAADGKYYFSAFESCPLKIVSVKSVSGNKLPYKLINDYLEVDCSECEVTYQYRPNRQELIDESYYSSGKLGGFTLAIGVAAQFCLEKGRLEESDIWQDKYMSAIKGRLAEKRRLKMPPRSWH